MKVVSAIIIFSIAFAGSAEVRGTVRVEQVSAGKPYHFVVHVKNSDEIGYNPEVSSDRAGMALALVKRNCPASHVVGQQTVITEIYGITSSKPDYLVFVSCAFGLRRTDEEGFPLRERTRAFFYSIEWLKVTKELHLNDDKSPLIELLNCTVCDETMKIEKSVPDRDGHDIIQYRCQRCARIERVRLFRRSRDVDWPKSKD
jgi:hypothetical protein